VSLGIYKTKEPRKIKRSKNELKHSSLPLFREDELYSIWWQLMGMEIRTKRATKRASCDL